MLRALFVDDDADLILDVTGQRVRALELSPERGSWFEWDLRRSDGGRVPAGVHFAIVTTRDGSVDVPVRGAALADSVSR